MVGLFSSSSLRGRGRGGGEGSRLATRVSEMSAAHDFFRAGHSFIDGHADRIIIQKLTVTCITALDKNVLFSTP